MTTYTVFVPCTLSICFEIEAENPEDAINKALESDLTVRVLDEHRNDINVEEFMTHKRVTQGNVFYGVLNEIQVEEA
jgi:hypothetical protein